jgi:CheY-like chemotaxis protein
MPTLLIIEDDADSREALRESLTSAGYQVQTARTAEEGLGRLAQSRFDGAVVDLALPDRSGPEVLELLRTDPLCAALPLLVHTAFPVTPQLRLRLMSADAVVEKDGRLESLLGVLENVLGARGVACPA